MAKAKSTKESTGTGDVLITEEVQEVLDKHTLSDNYRQSESFETNLDTWKDYCEGTSDETQEREDQGRSAILPPWPAMAVEHPLARFMLTLFGRKPYFAVSPLNQRAIESQEIVSDLIPWHLDKPAFYDEADHYIQSMLAYGFGVLLTGWDFAEKDLSIENWDIKHFFYSPSATNLTKLPWAIFELWRSLDDLKDENEAFERKHNERLYDLAGVEAYGKGLAEADDTTKYTEEEKRNLVQLLAYWDKGRKILVANKQKAILSTENPVGFIPAVCCSDTPKLEGILGTGEIEAIETYVRQLATVINQMNDNITLSLQPIWIHNINFEIENEDVLGNLAAGVRIKIDAPFGTDVRQALTPWEVPFVTGGALQGIQLFQTMIQDRLGLHDVARGLRPQTRETATGLSRLQAVSSLIYRYKIQRAVRTAFTLLLSQIIRWDQKYLPDDYVYLVRGTKAGLPQFRNISKEDIQGDFDFKEQITALDPEGTDKFKRMELLEALRIMVEAQQILQLPREKLQQVIAVILGTFDIPALEGILEESAAPTNPEQLIQQMLSQGMGQGSSALPGMGARTEAGMTEGKAEGGMMGKALGRLGG